MWPMEGNYYPKELQRVNLCMFLENKAQEKHDITFLKSNDII